jgi:ribokinase
MVGRVGDDVFGPALRSALIGDGIDVEDVAVQPGASSGVGVILVDGAGQSHVLATYGANLLCDDRELAAVERSLDSVDILVLQMEIPFAISVAAARAARERGVRVLLDPAPAAPISAADMPHFDIVAPNQTEAEVHTGVVVDSVDTGWRAAQILLDRGAAVAVVKMAELGVIYLSTEEEGHVPAFSVEAVDSTSAGDAFHGGLAVALAEGQGLPDAVVFGAAAGALAVTRPGVQDAMPNRTEVEALVWETRPGA